VSERAYRDLLEIEEVEDIMAEDGPAVVIDFWSPTCGPCIAMEKDFEAVASQFGEDEVMFCKINTATHGFLAAPFKVRSTPTILFVAKGQVLDAVVGRMNAQQLGTRAEWLHGKANKKGLMSRLLGR
jgi:thioredoxin-like negative regulator of GroEL